MLFCLKLEYSDVCNCFLSLLMPYSHNRYTIFFSVGGVGTGSGNVDNLLVS